MVIHKQSVHFDADVKLLGFIDKKINKLEHFFDRIIDANVILRLERTGQIQDKVAEIKINVPGSTMVSRETSKTFEESVDLAVEAIKRQIIRHKEKSRA